MGKKREEEPLDELSDLREIREVLWGHLRGVDPGSQTLGLGALTAQLQKVITRIAELESEQTEVTLADALAEARQRRADGSTRPSRRRRQSAS